MGLWTRMLSLNRLCIRFDYSEQIGNWSIITLQILFFVDPKKQDEFWRHVTRKFSKIFQFSGDSDKALTDPEIKNKDGPILKSISKITSYASKISR